jgi:hypothetical protein
MKTGDRILKHALGVFDGKPRNEYFAVAGSEEYGICVHLCSLRLMDVVKPTKFTCFGNTTHFYVTERGVQRVMENVQKSR